VLTVSSRTEPDTGRPPGTGTLTLDDANPPLRAHKGRRRTSKTTEQVAHTAYGLVQAAGEYLDHVRTARSWETRLNRTLIRPEPLEHRALALARDVITT